MFSCVLCNGKNFRKTSYEPTVFNNRKFEYLKCSNCGLLIISPFPTQDDFVKMYPVEYQANFDTGRTGGYDWLIEKIRQYAPGKDILDYGCGSCRVLREFDPLEYNIYGAEFSGELVEVLKDNFPGAQFFTIDAILNNDKKFDVIFLSNVLEHLVNPIEIISILKKKLKPGGIIMVEGPLEEQFNLAYLTRKLFFGFRRYVLKKMANHPPYHITRTNYHNQLKFFELTGFKTLNYNVFESTWPYPSAYNKQDSLSKKIQYYIGKLSVKVSKSKKGWGNSFFYLGAIK